MTLHLGQVNAFALAVTKDCLDKVTFGSICCRNRLNTDDASRIWVLDVRPEARDVEYWKDL